MISYNSTQQFGSASGIADIMNDGNHSLSGWLYVSLLTRTIKKVPSLLAMLQAQVVNQYRNSPEVQLDHG